MNESVLTAKQIPPLPNKPKFGIRDYARIHIYEFYREFSQQVFYFVDLNNVPTSQVFCDDAMNIYNVYGIYLKESVVTMIARKYLLIITEEDLETNDLEATVRAKYSSSGISYNACIIERDYEDDVVSADSVATAIRNVYPDIVFWNSGFEYESNSFYTFEEYKIFGDNCEYKDVNDFFSEHECRGLSYSMNLANIKQIGKEIIEYSKDKAVVFFMGEKASNGNLKFIYVSIAAALTMRYSLKFYIPKALMALYLDDIEKISSQRFNYLEDYLSTIDNPIDIGVTMVNNSSLLTGYICIKDYERWTMNGCRNYKTYRTTFSVLQVAIDLKNYELLEYNANHVNYDYNRVQVISIKKQFGLDSPNSEVAMEGLHQLNELIHKLETAIANDYKILDNIALNCSNVLLYRFNQHTYLAYVTNIETKVPYIVMPLSKGYTGFSRELNQTDLMHLYDMRIMEDGDLIINQLLKSGAITNENLHYNFPSHIFGVTIQSLPPKKERFTEDCCYTVEEIGIWSIQSSQLRFGQERMLLEFMPSKSIRSKEFLTYFGGPHPMFTTTMIVEPDSWR